MKIYDCFTFFNELDLLEIRLNELKDVVDHFVIIEGENTFQGNPKRLFFSENKERFSEFEDKIIHIVIPGSEMPLGNNWENERKSFNYFLNLLSLNDDDVVILSALDEVPSSESILESINKTPCTIVNKFYYFYLNTRYWTNNRDNNFWNGSVVYKYNEFKNENGLYDLFLRKTDTKIIGGWHFSFLGDAKNAVSKVNSYSHSEYNHLDELFYLEKIQNLKDPFDRNSFTGFDFIENEENLPLYVQENLDKFSKYIRSDIQLESILTTIGRKYGTDKSTYHNFTDFYHTHLNSKRTNADKILEIGVYNGASLNMWKEYFKKSDIIGIDIHNKSNFDDDRIKTFICDQSNEESIDMLFKNDKFDLIIDDGGHTMSQQQKSIIFLFSKLKPNGLYIIEDLHTSLIEGKYEVDDLNKSTLSMVKSLRDKKEFSSSNITSVEYCKLLKDTGDVFIFEQNQNDEFGKSITAIIYKN